MFIVRESNLIATYTFYSEIGQFKHIRFRMSWAVNSQKLLYATSERTTPCITNSHIVAPYIYPAINCNQSSRK